MTNYYCKHCKKIIKRSSTKQWIKSFCESTGKDVRLVRKSHGVQKKAR